MNERTAKNREAAGVDPSRLRRQLDFILEIDKAKAVLRRSRLLDGSRRENDAEHAWHLAVMALVLAEYANEPIDLSRVVKMLLVHDIVEIDAGDTFIYDDADPHEKAQREQKAAHRIFGLLPPDQRQEFLSLWQEFEERSTPDARFAAALDRLQPLLANYHTQGSTWKEHGITKAQVIARNRHMHEGSETLWQYAEALITDAVAKGYLADGT